MNKVGYFATFAVGAVIGAAATWFYVKKKYEKAAQEEIQRELDSLREVYQDKEKDLNNKLEEANEEYNIVVRKLNTINLVRKEPEVMLEPRAITPEEFEENEDEYEQVTVYYFKDGVVADMSDTPIEDVDGLIGLDNLKRIGEWEDDVIHVRNDVLQRDYEVLRDYGNFSSLVISKHGVDELDENDD